MRSTPSLACLFVPLTLLLCASSPTTQQFGNEWVRFEANPGSLPGPANAISSSIVEVDFAWGDVDQNGWTDVAAVRKQPWSTAGKQPNALLLNYGGALQNMTREYAGDSDVIGDDGFLTPTNDRDIELADLDNDGWLDMVTATASMDNADSKALGHPRVYRNQGAGPDGKWLGFRHEDARVPQLLNYNSGLPTNPVFCSVSAGDVTDDGFADVYFAHYDFSNNGFQQTANQDLDDRLLVNDGSAFFTDDSQARMSSNMLGSRFGLSTAIADMNADGYNDIIKNTALADPYFVSISYQDPTSPGFFNIFHDFHSNLSPYHVSVADLNQDARLDIVMGDDGPDRYRLNQGNDALGRVIWGPSKSYAFLAGGDDGFAGQNVIGDLDLDGFPDVLQCDVDTDEPGFNRRLHIYHNIGGVPGADVVLGEEREMPGGNGWLGAVGFEEDDLNGTFDVALFDIDNDGDNDAILGRGEGSFTWINQTIPNPLAFDNATISLADGGSQTLLLDAGPAQANDIFLLLGSTSGTTPGLSIDGVLLPLVPDAYTSLVLGNPGFAAYSATSGLLSAQGRTSQTFSLPPGLPAGLAGTTLHHAYLVFDAGTGQAVLASNAAPLTLFD